MSKLLHTTRCPRCASRGGDRSGNNLAVYDDGHEYCYACGFVKKPSLVEQHKSKQDTPVDSKPNWFVKGDMKPEGMAWLKHYGLTNKEVEDNYFWDDKGYCVFNGGTYQNGRNFNQSGAKYITKGTVKGNEALFVNVDNAELLSSCVIVEDAISAIKVSRVCSAVPLHNAVVPTELLLRLYKQFTTLYIWLDKDKAKEALIEAKKAKPYFDKVKVVWSDLDPKCYTEKEIKEYLNE